ncbi:MAG TPA: heavy metal sensor histidine kinase [Planctomycetota bacterium]|nr:heavy metal sensor histidine kinase [Planctomycetota bacterium]
MQTGFKFFSSLAGRLTAWYALSSFAIILVIAFVSYYALLSAFTREMDDSVVDTAKQLSDILANNGVADLKEEVERQIPKRPYMHAYARVLDEHGKVLTESRGIDRALPLAEFPRAVPMDPNARGVDLYSPVRRRTYRCVSLRIDEPRALTFQVACDRKREADILKRYKAYLWLVLPASFILCAVGGYAIARRGIRPVAKIAAAAGKIGYPALHARIDIVDLPSELAQLAAAFNAMLDRLEESFARLAQFSEDIAHELRTPVNNLRGGMEVVLGKSRTAEEYRDAIGSALEECERLARLVDRLLFIARSENSDIKIDRDIVSVRDELARTCEFYEATAEESGVKLSLEPGEALKLSANRDLLRSLVGNLVSNALAHTPHGGRVALNAAAVDHSVSITVSDTGSGIPPQHLPHIFDRFYRVDPSRTKTSGGVGLGLAIVSTIAKLHNAKLDVSSQLGKGTAITVRFPKE